MASLRATALPLARSSMSLSSCCSRFIPAQYPLAAGPLATRTPQTTQPLTSLSSSSIPFAPQYRHFSSTRICQADTPEESSPPAASPSPRSSLSSLSRALGLDDSTRPGASRGLQPPGEHHLYVYAHKHNTQITLSGPQYTNPQTKRRRQDVILTLSTGNIGYRKANRGTYEAAYQLGGYVMNRIQLDGLLPKIQRLEVVLRGFGNGRDALIKLLLGQEGAALRDRVIRVVDASRIKMGGQRAPRPRRLG